ncbi:MAG: ABC transporter permease subunit [Gammaproteobacteria bacterium]|nr:ABC transporter permease subunit [Gammaproteobacteria bacterium]
MRDNTHRAAARTQEHRQLAAWLALIAVAAVCIALRGRAPWLLDLPPAFVVPVADWFNAFMVWFIGAFKWLFRAANWLLGWPLAGAQALLQWLPWPATMAAFCALAFAASGWKLALFAAAALFYMALTGHWSPSMNTLGSVLVSIPLALAAGFALGVAAHRSKRVDRVMQPLLDLMQTVPTFAYLIPILLLFGFGPVVGVVASAIYACPPMVRNTLLGLRRVPREALESGLICGATGPQLFWWVQAPSALPALMVGVNQTTMAALSMVIIAAIIGGSADIGWEVLSTMRKAQFGQSLLAGIVIALIAMLLDRISWGFADRAGRGGAAAGRARNHGHGGHGHGRLKPWLLTLIALAIFAGATAFIPAARVYPEAWVFYPADAINAALRFVTANYSAATDAVKHAALFYYLLPLKIGLSQAVTPFSWGVALTPGLVWGYAAAVGVIAWRLFAWRGWRPAVAAVVGGGVLYFGVTGLPWPPFILASTLLAWQVGGRRVALLSAGGWAFMLLTGVWAQAMLSVYLCAAAVLVCALGGGALGVWASANRRVSNFLRPINDTLQSMPLFVILIPFLMFFQIGEFTSFLAIIAYAIVPTIRYTEHGLRHVPAASVEAAVAMGCTRRQLLWEVKMPLALPEIMLGVNQTVLFALAMLVITALVGSRGLGQSVYIALSNADPGLGLVAGLGIALIAIIADRIIQAWSAARKSALGIP